MRIIEPVSNDYVVCHFLQTEIKSDRFKQKIISTLEKLHQTREIIDDPNLSNQDENQIRARLLKDFRTSTFHKFPEDVKWFRATLTKDELIKVKYIDYSYWNELSKGTRLPSQAAKSVIEGLEFYGESNEGFIKAAEHIKSGGTFPNIILVAKDEKSDLVILEGHLRMTAYFLSEEHIPSELEVIIGFSKAIDKWVY